MNKKYKFPLIALMYLAVFAAVFFFLDKNNIALLNPKGQIAMEEKNLMVFATLLMLVVVIPVFILTFVVAWKYRADNKNAEYKPNWDYNFLVEAIWWGVPCIIIAILSWVTWTSTHALDPFKPLDSKVTPLRVQVVALNWKWLFIYPEQQIASVNFFQVPENRPINFEITADAPMNSFWIPQLGGQIYAMPGMTSKLHLIAQNKGEYKGVSANLSGTGFSGMKFTVKASSDDDFTRWVDSVKRSSSHLTRDAYKALAAPSEDNPVATYVLKDPDLFDYIVMKYMMPEAK